MYFAGKHLITVALLVFVLSGCQNTVAVPDTQAEPQADAGASDTDMYLRMYEDTVSHPGRVTLMAQDISILKAIKAAYPDAPISADPSVNLSGKISVWADSLTPTSYLEHLSDRADAYIWENQQGEIRVDANARWQFTLPDSADPSLMAQAQRIAAQAGVQTIIMGSKDQILLATGKPSQLATLRTALNQLSDRIELDTRFSNL